MQKNGFMRKVRLISKPMTSQFCWQTIAIHIFTNISGSKDNQTMKFGELTVYNRGKISLEKSHTKCGREIIPRPYSKKWKLSKSLDHYSKVLNTFFNCCPNWGLSKVIETKLQTIRFYLIQSFFKNQKGVWN